MPDTAIKLQISKIRRDGGTQPRVAMNQDTIITYCTDIRDGVILPPVKVVFDGTNYWLVDGFHRVSGAEAACSDEVYAEVIQGTRDDALWMSFAANQEHDHVGLRRTNKDKIQAVQAALQHPKAEGMSNVQMAEYLGVGQTMVRVYRDKAAYEKKVAEQNARVKAARDAEREAKKQQSASSIESKIDTPVDDSASSRGAKIDVTQTTQPAPPRIVTVTRGNQSYTMNTARLVRPATPPPPTATDDEDFDDEPDYDDNGRPISTAAKPLNGVLTRSPAALRPIETQGPSILRFRQIAQAAAQGGQAIDRERDALIAAVEAAKPADVESLKADVAAAIEAFSEWLEVLS